MDIYFYESLICTSIKVTLNVNTKIIHNVVIDTGAVESILSSNAVKDIGIKMTTSDSSAVTRGAGGGKMRFFYKVIDEIEIVMLYLENVNRFV